MPPTKTDTGHGGLFDLFPSRPQAIHGGARFDEGFEVQSKDAPKGRNFDEFGTPTNSEDHGQLFDDWREWTAMSDLHGGFLYDQGFASPSANETERGPLYDLFQPSTQVKFIYDGQDAEGIVDHVREDGAVMVKPRSGGNAVEVDLGQFLGYRSPSMDNATTTAERSTAESPSAWDQIAHGAKRGGVPEIGTPAQAVSEGPGNTNGRSDIGADWSVVDHLKTLLDGDDVAKVTGYHMHLKDGFATHTLGGKKIGTSRSLGGTEGGVMAHHKQGSTLMHIGTFPSHEAAHTAILGAHAAFAGNGETSWKTLLGGTDVAKSMGSPISGSLAGYRMTQGPNKSAVDHWSNDRRIGTSVEHKPGRVIAGYHHENDTVKPLGRGFTSHQEAHHALVSHHGGAAKSGHAPIDVLKTDLGLVEKSKFDEMVAKLLKENPDWDEERAKKVAASIGDKKYGAHGMAEKSAAARKTYLPSERLASFSEFGGVVVKAMNRIGVAKEVTVAETAVQAQEGASTLAGEKGAGSYCPECRADKKSLTKDGRCPDCNTVLKAHEDEVVPREKGDGNGSSEDSSGKGVAEKTLSTVDDLRKAFGASGDSQAGGQTVTLTGREEQTQANTGQATSDPDGPEVPERAHKETDHNSDFSLPKTCPHCGQPLAELDRKTEEGAPAHKCLEGLLGVTKAEGEAQAS